MTYCVLITNTNTKGLVSFFTASAQVQYVVHVLCPPLTGVPLLARCESIHGNHVAPQQHPHEDGQGDDEAELVERSPHPQGKFTVTFFLPVPDSTGSSLAHDCVTAASDLRLLHVDPRLVLVERCQEPPGFLRPSHFLHRRVRFTRGHLQILVDFFWWFFSLSAHTTPEASCYLAAQPTASLTPREEKYPCSCLCLTERVFNGRRILRPCKRDVHYSGSNKLTTWLTAYTCQVDKSVHFLTGLVELHQLLPL